MTDILTSPAVQDAVDHVEGSQPIRPAVLRAAQLAHEAEDHARDRQHVKGKLTARERLDLLLDTGTFEEIGRFCGGDINGGQAAVSYTHLTLPTIA